MGYALPDLLAAAKRPRRVIRAPPGMPISLSASCLLTDPRPRCWAPPGAYASPRRALPRRIYLMGPRGQETSPNLTSRHPNPVKPTKICSTSFFSAAPAWLPPAYSVRRSQMKMIANESQMKTRTSFQAETGSAARGPASPPPHRGISLTAPPPSEARLRPGAPVHSNSCSCSAISWLRTTMAEKGTGGERGFHLSENITAGLGYG